MRPPGPSTHRAPNWVHRGPASVALVYTIVGLIWIFLSDRLTGGLPPWVQSVKGAAYVLVTGAILYLALRALFSQVQLGEERFRRLVEGVEHHAFLLLDSQGQVASWNAGVGNLTGLRTEQLQGRRLDHLLLTSGPERITTPEALALAEHKGSWQYVGWLHRHGGRFWGEATVSPIRNDDQEITGYTLMLRDLTEEQNRAVGRARRLEQHEAVAALGLQAAGTAEMSELLHGAARVVARGLDLSHVTLFWLLEGRALEARAVHGWPADRVGQRIPLDPRFMAGFVLGHPEEVVVIEDYERELRFVVPPEVRAELLRSAVAVAIPGSHGSIGMLAAHSTEERTFTADDQMFVRTVATLLGLAAESRALRADLERRVEERTAALQEANAELNAFAHAVTHDLRAPLRALSGFSEALLEDYANHLDDTGRDYLGRLAQSALRMDDLILDLLEYSRLARADLSLADVRLEEVMDEALLQVTEAARRRGVSITVQRPLPVVRGQPGLLARAFAQLLDNAVKFSPEGTDAGVVVRAEACAGAWRVWVEDAGIGIAPEHHQRIFQPFERLHSSETYEGTGIGLAIVLRSVERLGGRSGVESAPGHGSRFYIELPAATRSPIGVAAT